MTNIIRTLCIAAALTLWASVAPAGPPQAPGAAPDKTAKDDALTVAGESMAQKDLCILSSKGGHAAVAVVDGGKLALDSSVVTKTDVPPMPRRHGGRPHHGGPGTMRADDDGPSAQAMADAPGGQGKMPPAKDGAPKMDKAEGGPEHHGGPEAQGRPGGHDGMPPFMAGAPGMPGGPCGAPPAMPGFPGMPGGMGGAPMAMGGMGGMPGGMGAPFGPPPGMMGAPGMPCGPCGPPPAMPGGPGGHNGPPQAMAGMPGGHGGPGGPGGHGGPGAPGGEPGEGHEPGPAAAAILVSKGATAKLKDVHAVTALRHGMGLFAVGDKADITLAGGDVVTSGPDSPGALALAGGAVTIKDATMTTSGPHSPALDAGPDGGAITVKGGAFTATGPLSPALRAVGAATLVDASLVAMAAPVAVVETGGAVKAEDCSLRAGTGGAVILKHGPREVAATGRASLDLDGGSVAAARGPLFFVAGAASDIRLRKVTLTAPSGLVLVAMGGRHHGPGPKAGETDEPLAVKLDAVGQTLPGDVAADGGCAVTLALGKDSVLRGALNRDGRAAGMNLTLDRSSTWEVTADSHVTHIEAPGLGGAKPCKAIKGNGHTVYYAKDANPALKGGTYPLADGGELRPE